MADAVTSQTIIDGERNCIMKFTNVSDGTGESAVAKVDVSALTSNSAGSNDNAICDNGVGAGGCSFSASKVGVQLGKSRLYPTCGEHETRDSQIYQPS